MRVTQTAYGKWRVISQEGEIISEHETNAQAWKTLDRLASEPVNKREAIADWSFRKAASGE